MDILGMPLIILIVLVRGIDCDGDSFLLKFVQHDFKVRNARFELKNYNEDYVNLLTFTTFKYNRTTVAINCTANFKISLENKFQALVQGYKFLSNEYRILTGFCFQVDFCKAVNSNMMGAKAIFNCGNFKTCFIEKDVTYHVCNYLIDDSRLPPHIPDGEYKAEVDIIYSKHIICTANVYLEIYRPIYPKK